MIGGIIINSMGKLDITFTGSVGDATVLVADCFGHLRMNYDCKE